MWKESDLISKITETENFLLEKGKWEGGFI